MAYADLPLLMTLGALLGLAVLATGLVRAVWRARSLPFAPIASAVLLMVVGARAFSQPETRGPEVFVAAASHREPDCKAGDPTHVGVSGQRVRLGGESLVAPSCGLWAVVEDPRTGLRWVQGPASTTESGWAMDLLVGIDDAGAQPLVYGVSLVAIPPSAHEAWLSVALQGVPVALEGHVPPAWLARGFQVMVE